MINRYICKCLMNDWIQDWFSIGQRIKGKLSSQVSNIYNTCYLNSYTWLFSLDWLYIIIIVILIINTGLLWLLWLLSFHQSFLGSIYWKKFASLFHVANFKCKVLLSSARWKETKFPINERHFAKNILPLQAFHHIYSNKITGQVSICQLCTRHTKIRSL